MGTSDKKKDDIIHLVCRQTDYTYEIAKQKLEESNYNYQEVIKCYMQPTKYTPELPQQPKSVNQQIYYELRRFLDGSCKDISLLCGQDKPTPTCQQKKNNECNKLDVIAEEDEESEEDEAELKTFLAKYGAADHNNTS